MTRVILVTVPLLLAAAAVVLIAFGGGRQDAAVLLWGHGTATHAVAIGHQAGRPLASSATDRSAGPGQATMVFVVRGPIENQPSGPNGVVPAVWDGWGKPPPSFAGFSANRWRVRVGRHDILWMFLLTPAWALLVPLPLAALPAVPWLRRRRRARQGLCLACGYDLRGQPADSRRCPECGRAPPIRP